MWGLVQGCVTARSQGCSAGLVQVLDWTQTMLTVGEAFSGCESSTLRDAIARQSGRFFQAYHAANLQVSQCLLQGPS